jgi:flagellar protein FlgJ
MAVESSYLSFEGIAALRRAARREAHSPETLRRVAAEFEALFLQMILKNMRAAPLAEDVLGGESSGHYQDWLDAQLALTLAHRPGGGLGIGRLLVEQLVQGQKPQEAAAGGRVRESTEQKVARDGPGRAVAAITPEAFVRRLAPYAVRAAATLGVAPEALLAQAALESGWGRAEIRYPDGRPSHNVFAIKAGPDWPGARVPVSTLEYQDGIAVRRVEFFRAYGSYEEAFDDYVRLLSANPRYAEALAAGSDPERFAAALQEAGYATDPVYARKLVAVWRSVSWAQWAPALKLGVERSPT